MTMREFARAVGRSHRTVSYHLAQGRIVGAKQGEDGVWYIPRANVKRWRNAPSTRLPRSIPTETWVCETCPADDNEWPSSAFRGSGNAFLRRRICDDCFTLRYGARRTAPCSGRCGGSVRTRKAEGAMCRACRTGSAARGKVAA